MKRRVIFLLIWIWVLGLIGCGHQTLENKPSITGIVEEVQNNYLIIYIKTDGYPDGASCQVSLDSENADHYPKVSVGDEVLVHYNGEIAESYPLQINTVYDITLKTPANQDVE